MKNIFITGGAGFIGSHTIDHAISLGYTVTIYDKKSLDEAVNIHHHKNDIRYIHGNILDFELLKKSMIGHTHVLHLAAVVSVQETIQDPVSSHEVNVTGTLNVFQCARELGVERVVYASSAAVYGMQEQVPISENVLCTPQSPYGLHKLINDEYAHLYIDLFKQSILGLRYFNVYGLRQDPRSPYSGVISIFTEQARNNQGITIYGDGSVTRDFVSVYDIARANVVALESSSIDVCNIGTGIEMSLNELVLTYERILGKKINCTYVEKRTGDILRSCANVEHAHSEMNYRAQETIESGLRKIINLET